MRIAVGDGTLRQATCGRFRLGDRRITPEANDIDGTRVEAKSMDVLVALVNAAPAVVSARELLDRVWPDVAVVDNVVYQAVA
jgi:DNA-binding winged helix-turn-helix (wHTH) protein